MKLPELYKVNHSKTVNEKIETIKASLGVYGGISRSQTHQNEPQERKMDLLALETVYNYHLKLDGRIR